MKLMDTLVKYLKDHSEQKFTAREIADWIVKTYPEEGRQKKSLYRKA